MNKPLVVVESPTKIRTLKKYIGNNYNIAATVGHIRDLPPRELGIEIDNGFKPKYQTINGKQKVITSLKKAAGNATDIYLAPDPDREGEAIAFHAAHVLKKKGRQFHRVLFHELTRKAIDQALATPLELHHNKYDAQQARRVLDRLVGYQISPLLWRKVKGRLSAGRVQSVAVRIICERERAIHIFVPVEYWSVTAHLEGDTPPPFTAKLTKKDKQKITIPDETTAKSIVSDLADETFRVDDVRRKTVRRRPLPPFITSKLQQEAIRKLRFSAKKTMIVAQQLYEGIDIAQGGPVGLITYMRTDSTRIANEAALEALELIQRDFGPDYAPAKPRFFKNRQKAQDAHEAIRPTSVFNIPEKLAAYLSKDQLALYRLIWQRFVASQMQEALIDQVSVIIKAGVYQFNASGSTIKFPGFMKLYMSAEEQNKQAQDKQKMPLPELRPGMVLKVNKIDPKQHFTQPPPRFSEASLVKELEENGIGRPSTYAAILSTIQTKGYVEMLKRYFRPTELGFIVNDLLVQTFPDLFDVAFTAGMEKNLDRVETDDLNYFDLLNNFYHPFKKTLDAAQEGMTSMRGVGFATDIKCPDCKTGQLHVKVGKNGHYLACNSYPECRFTRNYERDEKGRIHLAEQQQEESTGEVCEKCGSPMVLKQGRFGPFIACSGYPECKNTRSVNASHKGNDTGVKCPEKKCDGFLVERKSRRGKIFYGCNRYPDCKFALWDKPVAKACPQCNEPFLIMKSTKKDGEFIACRNRQCGYREDS
ncbi:type I DNA topoisomerase [Desulfococcaceae bacterium HSG9]|nr:type I DNA topoisomerase [Desulfococcaceae bacterium HSG9]